MSESGYALQPNAAATRVSAPVASSAVVSGEVALPRSGEETRPFASRLLWLVSFPAMLGALLTATVFFPGRNFFVDGDLWCHIQNGKLILATGHFPTTDPYTFTVAGQPWITCEWIGDLLLASVSRMGGLVGLDMLLIALGSAVVIALYYYGTLRSGNSKAGFVTVLLLSPVAFVSFTLRPQMLGYLFLVLTMIALEFFRRGRHRAIWFLPPLMLLWVNSHGSFVIGLGAIFVYWIAGLKEFELGGIVAKAWTPSERRQISFTFLLCLAALPITPYGTQIAIYPFQVAFKLPFGVAHVDEWESMPFHDPLGKIFLGVLIAFIVLQIARRFSWRLEELCLFLFGTVMACLHARFILIFVPFCIPILTTMLAHWIPVYEREKDRYAVNAILMAGLSVTMIWFHPTISGLRQDVAAEFPVAAVNYIKQNHVAGPLFNEYSYGGYLIWSGEKVFVDGRADPEERGGALADYFRVAFAGPGALRILENYKIHSCLIKPGTPLDTLLASQASWQKVYSDNNSVLFVRRDSALTSISTTRKSQ